VIHTLNGVLGPLEKVSIWGHPYHGPVQSSQLTLPNASTMSYLQPSSADSWAITLTGVPAVIRSESEQIQDEASGFQWLQKVVISGEIPQVYGKRLVGDQPSWLWRDSAGVVWQMTLPRLSTYQTSIRVRVRKFGRIGESAFTPVDVDLSHLVDNGYPTVSLATVTSSDLDDTLLRVCDINADGSKAIVGIFAEPPQTIYDGIYILRRPVQNALGFVRIDITDGETVPSLSLTTLRNHRAVLGSVSGSDTRDPSDGYTSLPIIDFVRTGTVAYTSSSVYSGRIISMYFGAAGVEKEITIGYNSSDVLTREFGDFTVDVPGYPASSFTEKFTRVSRSSIRSLQIDGAEVASVDPASILNADEAIAEDLTFYYPLGVNYYWLRRDLPATDSALEPYDELAALGGSKNSPQIALWEYSKKLYCLYRIDALSGFTDGLVTWTNSFGPGISATAPTPASGGWIATGFAGRLADGPATWFRAVDPLTDDVSTVRTSPICYV
jgi:hypothetical protein